MRVSVVVQLRMWRRHLSPGVSMRVPVVGVRVGVRVHVRMWRHAFSAGMSVCDAGRVLVRVRVSVLMLVRLRTFRRDFSSGGPVRPASLDQMELRCRHPRPQHPLSGHFVLADAEAPQRAAEVLQREPRVEQRTQDHVARGAIETVEIQQLHTEVSGHRRRP